MKHMRFTSLIVGYLLCAYPLATNQHSNPCICTCEQNSCFVAMTDIKISINPKVFPNANRQRGSLHAYVEIYYFIKDYLV